MTADRRAPIDLAIIGAGPAGAVLASLLRRAHPERRIAIVERERFPRHKVGESLIAGVGPILARAGLLEPIEALASRAGNDAGIVRKAGAVFSWGPKERETWSADFREPDTGLPAPGSYQVDRARFDAFLLDHARGLGVELVEGEVRGARVDDGACVLEVRDGERTFEMQAGHLVDASGQARCASRLLGIEHVGLDDMNNFAIHGYWAGSRRLEHGAPLKHNEAWTYVATTRDGWCWHIHIGEDLVSVGLVTSKDAIPRGGEDALRAFYLANVEACEGVGELLRGAALVPKAPSSQLLHVVRDWSSHATRLAGPGYFLVGDAAAFVDPILTSGVMLALTAAGMCANAITSLWSDPSVDAALLADSYHDTYMDLVLGYHRLAQVWYRSNDRLASWWWEARRSSLRGGADPSRMLDLRGFLGFAMGLVRDPLAARAIERDMEIDAVRPDKVLFVKNLFRDAELVEARLEVTLEHLTSLDHGEIEARGILYAHMNERWRELLDEPITLVPLRLRRIDRYYTDRTLDRWRRTRCVECVDPSADRAIDRIVMPEDTPLDAPLGIRIEPGDTLRGALERALAPFDVGSQAYRSLLERTWRRVAELDVRGWIRPLPDATGARDPSEDLAVSGLALSGDAPVRVEIDLLGRSVMLTPLEHDVAVQLAVVRDPSTPPRAYRVAAGIAISYLRGEPSGPSAQILARVIALAKDAAPVGALAALLAQAADAPGACVEARRSPDGSTEVSPRMPEDRPRRG
ncbi:MAG: NAD(P)/FAD-dependent oxidoreductase [Sandaracinaceae bacterium]